MGRWIGFLAVAIALLLGARTALSLLEQSAEEHAFIWPGLTECQEVPTTVEHWEPRRNDADRLHAATYRCDETLVNVRVFEYFSQGPGKEAVGGEHRLQQRRSESVASGLGFHVNELQTTTAAGEELLIWQWYGIGAEAHADEDEAKLAEIRRVLTLQPTASTVFWVAGAGQAAAVRDAVRTAAESVWSSYLEARQP